jgi:hypothetical protein
VKVARTVLRGGSGGNAANLLGDEAETGNGGDQPVRNNLNDWNEKGGLNIPQSYFPIPIEYASKNALLR